MKLYRAGGSVNLIAYFLADDDADAFTKADTALWTEDCEGTHDGDVRVHSLRKAASLREVRAEGWGNKPPYLIPEDMTTTTCEEFWKMERALHVKKVALQQQVFFFYHKGWDNDA